MREMLGGTDVNGKGGVRRREESPERTTGFPWTGLALVMLVALLFLLVVLVAVPATYRGEATAGQIVMSQFTGIAAFTGVLITGVFVFMAFRIDNGTKSLARSEAQAVAKDVSEMVAETTAAGVAQRALGQMVRSEVRTYLNGDDGSNVVEETILANLCRTVEQLLPREVRKQLGDELDLRLPGLVGEKLPGLVAERLPAEVASALPGVLAKALPAELTQQLATALPPVVDEKLPGVVSERLPAEVEARFKALLEERIRAMVESILAEMGVTGREGGGREECVRPTARWIRGGLGEGGAGWNLARRRNGVWSGWSS